MGFGAALVCRPEFALQAYESTGFAPGLATAPDPLALCHPGESGGPGAAAAALSDPCARLDLDARFCGHDKLDHRERREAQGDERPENLPQSLEKMESAPGIAAAPEAENPAQPARVQDGSADLVPSLSKDAPDRGNVAARWSMLRDATPCVAPQHEGQGFPFAASASDGRPENPPQGPENMESAPGNDGAASAPASRPISVVSSHPTHFRRVACRMTLNGVMAC